MLSPQASEATVGLSCHFSAWFLALHLLQISKYVKEKRNQEYWAHNDAFFFKVTVAFQGLQAAGCRGCRMLFCFVCSLPSF